MIEKTIFFLRMGNSKIHKYSFSLSHQIKDIELIEQAIDVLGQDWDIDTKSLFHLNLVLEELISNTMYYGFSGMEKGRIDVDLSFDGTYIQVKIHDDALAFDPTVEAEDTSAQTLDERAIGGLGIMLSQRISEDMIYRYHESKNKLSFKISTKHNY